MCQQFAGLTGAWRVVSGMAAVKWRVGTGPTWDALCPAELPCQLLPALEAATATGMFIWNSVHFHTFLAIARTVSMT